MFFLKAIDSKPSARVSISKSVSWDTERKVHYKYLLLLQVLMSRLQEKEKKKQWQQKALVLDCVIKGIFNLLGLPPTLLGYKKGAAAEQVEKTTRSMVPAPVTAKWLAIGSISKSKATEKDAEMAALIEQEHSIRGSPRGCPA